MRSRQNSYMNASMISQSQKVLQSQVFDPMVIFREKLKYLIDEIPGDGFCPKKFTDYMSKKTYNSNRKFTHYLIVSSSEHQLMGL